MPRKLQLYVAAGVLAIVVTPLLFPWPVALGISLLEAGLMVALLDGRRWAHAVNRCLAIGLLAWLTLVTPQTLLSALVIDRVSFHGAAWLAALSALTTIAGQGLWLWILSQPDVTLWLMDRHDQRALHARLVRS